MRIAILGTQYPEYERYCQHWTGQKEALSEMEIEYIFLDCRYDRHFVEKVIDFKPDLIIYGLYDMVFKQDAREKIRRRLPKAKIVLWFGDLRDERTKGVFGINCAETIDTMFVSNDGQEKFYQRYLGLPAKFLPLACCEVKERKTNLKYKYPLVFIGQITKNGWQKKRADIVSEILDKTGGKWINETDCHKRAEVYKSMPEIYGNAEVSLDISHFWDIPCYTSNRFWVIPMCYGFALTKRFPDCERFFKDKIHRVYFDTVGEAIELISYYKNHEEEREKIRLAGYQQAMEKHTYKERFKEMFKILKI